VSEFDSGHGPLREAYYKSFWKPIRELQTHGLTQYYLPPDTDKCIPP